MAMTTGRTIGLVAIVGAAGYLLFLRRDPVTGRTLGDSLLGGGAPAPLQLAGPGNINGVRDVEPSAPGTRAMGIIGASVGTATAVAPLLAGGATAAGTAAAGGGGSAAAAGAGGIGAAGAAMIAGAIGGGVLLTWAVWKKGLFRGGEEALHVNPDRDQFLLQFGPPGLSPESGFHRLAALLTEITGEPNGSSYFTALVKADTIKEFVEATRAIQAILQQRGIVIQAP